MVFLFITKMTGCSCHFVVVNVVYFCGLIVQKKTIDNS